MSFQCSCIKDGLGRMEAVGVRRELEERGRRNERRSRNASRSPRRGSVAFLEFNIR